MTRLDYYDILPKGMDAYLASHGHHFSQAMYEWAVSMMVDKNGNKMQLADRKQLDNLMTQFGVKLERNEGYYDPVYVWCMGRADYLGSSIPNEQLLAKFVKDYMDDVDGNPTRPFDEFVANCMAKGIDIPWGAMI